MGGTYVRQVWGHDPHLYAPKRYRKACAYDTFIPNPIRALDPSIPGTLQAAISEAETSISALNAASSPHLASLARLLLRTESIASSKVEGLQVDARSLARAEVKQETGRSIGSQAAEILASIDAMQFAIERASDRPITTADLQDIHTTLMKDVAPKIAGNVRTVQNWIGGNDYNPCGADFVPPPPELLGDLLLDLCDFCNDDSLSPLVQAAIAHAQFETLHPFADGNGRTGRALVQVMLRRSGLAQWYVPPISVMLARHRDSYIRGLTLFREGDVGGWLAIFADAAAGAARLATTYRLRIDELQQRWRQQLGAIPSPPRSDAAAWAIIDALPAYPVLTLTAAIAATSRTRPAIVNAVQHLQQAGVLAPLSGGPRNKAWEAADLLDMITDLEDGVLP